METHFGNSAAYYFNVVRGIHNSEVKPHRIQKSVGAERTFEENISSEIFLLDKLEHISAELEKRITRNKVAGKTVTLKIKYSDFSLQTRSKTLPYFISQKELIMELAKELLYQEAMRNSVRLLGISLSNLNTEPANEKITSKNHEVAVQLQFEF